MSHASYMSFTKYVSMAFSFFSFWSFTLTFSSLQDVKTFFFATLPQLDHYASCPLGTFRRSACPVLQAQWQKKEGIWMSDVCLRPPHPCTLHDKRRQTKLKFIPTLKWVVLLKNGVRNGLKSYSVRPGLKALGSALLIGVVVQVIEAHLVHLLFGPFQHLSALLQFTSQKAQPLFIAPIPIKVGYSIYTVSQFHASYWY